MNNRAGRHAAQARYVWERWYTVSVRERERRSRNVASRAGRV